MTDPQNTGATRVGSTEDISIPQQTTRSTAMDTEPGAGRTTAPPTSWRDRVRWGPVWAGVVVILPVYVVLQLFVFAIGWVTLGIGGGAAAAGPGILALISFFVGGLVAGASTAWSGAPDGIFHGVIVWAMGVISILLLTLIGGSSLLGPLAIILGQAGMQGQGIPPLAAAEALAAARTTAGVMSLGLGIGVLAAALGGMVGAKLWPSRAAPREQVTRG